MTTKEDKKPMTNREKYPHWDKIRDTWVSNQSHCDPNSPSARKHYIEKGICFSDKWLGEVGYLRYYLFHVDNDYLPGRSKLQRIDGNKGFSPQNCYIEHYPKNDKKDSEIKPDYAESKDSKSKVKKSVSLKNVTNNFIIVDSVDSVIKAMLNGGYVFD